MISAEVIYLTFSLVLRETSSPSVVFSLLIFVLPPGVIKGGKASLILRKMSSLPQCLLLFIF